MADNIPNSTAKQALAAIQQLQGRIRELENAGNEPIAVVGMGCRFPGNVNGPDAFWDALMRGVDGIVEVPAERWEVDEFYDPEMDAPGKMYTRYAGFIDQIDRFDASFFGISPREAVLMDPQQRLLLQTVWESFEYGGFDMNKLYGSKTGVYVGISNFEYGAKGIWPADKKKITAYSGTGGSLGVAAGRMSYVYGFTGPSMIVDTACSSSLVTTHLAMQALRNGECDLAVSAGVNLIMGPETHIYFCQGHMLAPDGHCKTFSSDANGYARGEGVGVLLLKRLSDAQRDGDRILGLLLGSAVNQDGPSGGLTVPNGPSQEAVIKAAIKNARIKPADVGYIEAHGTGTSLGDPIEISALSRVFGKDRDAAANPLYVASVKTNIGHLESAAGIAGLIKTILTTSKGVIPPHQNFKAPNPHIDWKEFPGQVALQATEWKTEKRIGGVSSFSFSGTNAHVVVSNYVSEKASNRVENWATITQSCPSERVLALSGHSDSHLLALSNAYRSYLEANPATDWHDFCTSAALGRTHHPKRATIVAADVASAVEQLTEGVKEIRTRASGTPRIAFQFTGQGSQFSGMGKDLYEQMPVFKAAIDECVALCVDILDVNLLEIMFEGGDEESGRIHNTRYTQPAIFAYEYAYSKLLMSLGVVPELLVGHSLGEFVAATISGVLNLKDAVLLVCERGRLMVEKGSTGSMISISLPAATVREVIGREEFRGKLDIAGINTTEQVTVAGESNAVAELCEVLESMGADFKRLKISHAFHCPLAEPMVGAFREVLSTVAFGRPNLELITTIQGTKHTDITTPEYWCTHLRKPVDYVSGIEFIANAGIDVCIEVGPKPILTAFGKLVSESSGLKNAPVWISVSKKQSTPWVQLLQVLSVLYESGFDEPLKNLYSGGDRYPIDIPPTPFITDTYWIEKERHTTVSTHNFLHPLLHEKLDSPALDKNTSIFRTVMSPDTLDFLAHHKVGGRIVLPAAAHIEMMYSAASRFIGTPELTDFEIHSALILAEEEPSTLQVVVKLLRQDILELQLFSKNDSNSDWQHHSSCRASTQTAKNASTIDLLSALKPFSSEVPVQEYYDMTHDLGIEHGSRFRALERLFVSGDDVAGQLKLPQPKHPSNRGFTLHPALLDAAFQVSSYALKAHQSPFLPVGAASVNVFSALPESLNCISTYVGKVDHSHKELYEYDLILVDEKGSVCAQIDKLRFQKVSMKLFQESGSAMNDWLFTVDWKSVPIDTQVAHDLHLPDFASGDLVDEIQEISDSCYFYGDLFQELDSHISLAIVEALGQLGWIPEAGELIIRANLEENLGIHPSFSALFTRCMEILDEDGFLSTKGEKIEVIRSFSEVKSTKMNSLLTKFPLAKPEISLVERSLGHLSAVLTGKMDPIQVLFPNDEDSSAANLYKYSVGSASINKLLALSLKEMLSSLPEYRKISILEVGAGTGGTTSRVLPILPSDRTEYWYTDVSRHFLNHGKQNFAAEFPYLQYGLFDVETNESELPEVLFDVVIAANVLHATNDLSKVIDSCTSRLKPGGVLLLLEAAPKQRWLDVTFGMTDGWWRFKNSDALRSGYPLLAFDEWKQLLGQHGFESVSMAGEKNETIADGLCQQVIIAKNSSQAEPNPNSVVIIGDSAHKALKSDIAFTQFEKTSFVQFNQLNTLDAVIQAEKATDVVLIVNSEKVSFDSLLDSQHILFSRMQSVVKAISSAGLHSSAKLWIVADHAFSSKSDTLLSSNWSLSGLVRSLRTEFPELQATLIDPGTSNLAQIGSVLQYEMFTSSNEDLIRYNDGSRMVQRLVSEAVSNENIRVSTDATYLVTGGFGPLGMLAASHLAELGARHIVLMGRNLPEANRLGDIQARFEATGTSIYPVQGDVSDPDDVSALFESNLYPSIKGIIHSAGTLSDRTFDNMTSVEIDQVMRSKVLGSWLLHSKSAANGLDFFIAFSSIGALFGPTGQSNYAAANAWMDQLMLSRVHSGNPGLTINWGAWSGESLANRNTGSTKSVLLNSISEIQPEHGSDLFGRIFASKGQVVVVPFKKESVHESLRNMSFLGEIFSSDVVNADADSSATGAPQLTQLQGVDLENEIIRIVIALTAKVLGNTPDKIDPTLGFFDLGMDSLTSVELRNALQSAFNLSLPTTLIFKYPSIEALASYLVGELSGSDEPKQPEAVQPKDSSDEKTIQELSEDELSALIDDAFNDVLGDKE